jgi:sn-glycerol 3-phosphate transport system permease protein
MSAVEAQAATPRRSSSGRVGDSWLRSVSGLFYLLPALALLGAFFFFPLGRSVFLSLHGSDMFGRPANFVGLAHYWDLFASRSFGRVLWVTFAFTSWTVVPSIIISLVLALLLSTQVRGVRFLRTAFALPFAYSVAAASVVFGIMFNPVTGILNTLLSQVGMGPVNWLNDPKVAFYAVCAATVWMQLGYNLLVLSAGLAAVPDELIEAARLDGAATYQVNWYIVVPMLTPQLFFLSVTGIMHALQSFGQINILTRGGPADTTSTLVYSIYETAFANNNSDFGAGSAQSIVLLAIVLLVTLIQFWVVERKVFYK